MVTPKKVKVLVYYWDHRQRLKFFKWEDVKSIVACLLFTANTAFHVEWHKRFQEGRVSLQDDARPGQAHRAITSAVIAGVDGLIRGNRRITVEEFRRLVGISHGSLHVIATKHLHYRKICAQ
ncbi:hypothetical protein ANN_00923 [Periplaneta americana]|uniref:Uncharacterized protein n=1 Tax=Periplaneta americana TaxID=6978 RepID=A0ABQ8TV13_PERAM|nr:hypothetical protein ANN_00923 [Periplaneta americana]